MANPQHLEWLKEGVAAWNSRRAGAEIQPDLQNADLHMTNLQEANLRNANLQGANLQGANLQSARLYGAELLRADIRSLVIKNGDKSDGGMLVITDISGVKGISQEQLSSMLGDSLTKIPPQLTRPTHWPEATLDLLEYEKESSTEENKDTSKTDNEGPAKKPEKVVSSPTVRYVARYSEIELYPKAGKLDLDDKPALVPPANTNSAQLAKIVSGQTEIIRLLLSALESCRTNWFIPTLPELLESYQSALNPLPDNWFLLSGPFNIAHKLLNDEMLGAHTPTIISTHFNSFQSSARLSRANSPLPST